MFATGTNPVVTLRTAPAARRRDLRGRAGRRGNILLGFAILLFAIFALAALVIDLGVRSMTQRQMQTAVDAAAVEGLRFRDDPSTLTPDIDRRVRASQVVAATFDADGDLTTTPADTNIGAGPLLRTTSNVAAIGNNDLDANALLSIGDPAFPTAQRVWVNRRTGPGGQPLWLELNLDSTIGGSSPDNEIHGDIVAGTFVDGQPHSDGRFVGGVWQPYNRQDFTNVGDSALLVRMRRTNNVSGLDRVPGVSAGGPVVPFLFGRGSLLQSDGTAGNSPRREGMSVRATAIADAQPAMTVGTLDPFRTIDGVGPVAIALDTWTALVTGTPVNVTIQSDGTLIFPSGSGGAMVRTAVLAAAMTAADTTMQVVSSDGFVDPAIDGPYRVWVGPELVEVTAWTTPTTWTVTRAIQGTTAVAHGVSPTRTRVMLAAALGFARNLTPLVGGTLAPDPGPPIVTPVLPLLADTETFWAPVYATQAQVPSLGATDRAVLFFARITVARQTPGVDFEVFTVTREAGRIAPQNASGVLARSIPLDYSGTVLEDLLTARTAANPVASGGVAAPALRRAYGFE